MALSSGLNVSQLLGEQQEELKNLLKGARGASHEDHTSTYVSLPRDQTSLPAEPFLQQ